MIDKVEMVQAFRIMPLLALVSVALGDAVNDLENQGRVALNAQLAKSKTCTKEKLMVRKEW